MTAISVAPARRFPAVRPITTPVTGLQVVPNPAPSKGFFRTAAICALVLLLALGTAFFLNTQMVHGAYEIKRATIELNELKANVDTIRGEVIMVSSAQGLQDKAVKIGMVPATDVRYLDFKTGEVTAAKQE